jgi:WD40 repeat protein
MAHTLTWQGEYLYISTGATCEVLTATSDVARFFATEDVSILSPDGALLAFRDLDHIVRVRAVASNGGQWQAGGVLFSCQKLSDEPVLGYSWSADGKLLAVQQKTVTSLYQIKSGWQSRQGQQKAAYRPEYPSLEYRPMAFAPGGTRVAQAIQSGVALWDALSGRLVRTIGQGRVESIAWDATGTYLALGKSDSTFAVYSLRGRLLVEQTGHTATVSALTWSPDGERLLSGDAHGNLHVWEVDEEAWIVSLRQNLEAMPTGIEAFAWSPDACQVAVLDRTHLDIFTCS